MNKLPINTAKILMFIFSTLVLGLCALVIMIPGIFSFLLRPPQSAIDATQFNTNRQPVLDTTLVTEVIPKQVGDFLLQEFTNNGTYQNIQQNIFAIYKNGDNQTVNLQALLTNNITDYRPYLKQGSGCGDCGGTIKVYTKAPTSYGYSFCACMGFAGHRLNWVNGHWVFIVSTASTLESDGDTLLNFTNSYPF